MQYSIVDVITAIIAIFSLFLSIISIRISRKDKEKEYAKYFLYRENPLVSILVPGKNEGKHIFKMVNSLAGIAEGIKDDAVLIERMGRKIDAHKLALTVQTFDGTPALCIRNRRRSYLYRLGTAKE